MRHRSIDQDQLSCLVHAPTISPSAKRRILRPGDDHLLTAIGWPNVENVLKIVDAIEAIEIDAIDFSPGNWLHAHSRMPARQAATRQRHQAMLLCRRTEL